MPGIGFNSMKNPAVYNKKISLLQAQGLPVQPCKAASLVDADDLHFFVPVVVQGMEDHTVVGVGFYGKFK